MSISMQMIKNYYYQTNKGIIGHRVLSFCNVGEDVETQDFWSDGPADLVRTPNKVLNVWFSQMIENRTLKNFQMQWYDSTARIMFLKLMNRSGKDVASSRESKETIMPVAISGLEDTLAQIDFLIKLVERGTSATAIEKGVSEKKQITASEVDTLLGQSLEKAVSMAKHYKRSWEELAMKWYRINEANTSDSKSRKLYKVSGKGNIWPREVYGRDWKSKVGYKAISQSTSEQNRKTQRDYKNYSLFRIDFQIIFR